MKRKVGEYKRPSREEFWMRQVDDMALMSTCLNYQIGCYFVEKNNKYGLVGGYNGPPPGESNCCEVGCSKLDKDGNMKPPNSHECIGCHAEMNTGFNGLKRGITVKDIIVYCTSSPCWDCAKHLISLGLIRFVYKEIYKDDFEKVKKLFQRHNIIFKQYYI